MHVRRGIAATEISNFEIIISSHETLYNNQKGTKEPSLCHTILDFIFSNISNSCASSTNGSPIGRPKIIRYVIIISWRQLYALATRKSLPAGPSARHPAQPPHQPVDYKESDSDQRGDPKRLSEEIDCNPGDHSRDNKKLHGKDPPVKCQYDSSEFFFAFVLLRHHPPSIHIKTS